MGIKEVILTPEQQGCLNFPDNKNLLIRGIAGSGKSLVILKKAVKIAKKSIEEGSNKRIGVFTYANTLVSYTKEILNERPEIAAKITVSTMDSELLKLYSVVIGKNVASRQMSYAYNNERKCEEILEKVIKGLGISNRFLEPSNREFLKNEITWIKQRMYEDKDSYLNCERVGRGSSVKPTKNDRSVIFDVYKKYYVSLKQSNIYDADEMFEELYQRKNEIPDEYKYTNLLIDECQDLALNKLLLARELCTGAVVLAADYAQKIYMTGFSWKELGFEIKGQASKKLKGTFRNTKQILRLANSLVAHNNLIKNHPDEYIEPELPDVEGNKPKLFKKNTYTEERDFAIELAKKVLRDKPDSTVAIMTNLKKDLNWIAAGLDNKGVEYDLIKKGEVFKVLKPGIKLVNFFSSKGLEFDTVIITLLDAKKFPVIPSIISEDQIPDIVDRARNIFYVAITRAKYDLFMIACGGSGRASCLIADLDTDLYDC